MNASEATSSAVTLAPEYLPLLQTAGLDDYEAVMACRRGEALVKAGLGRRERIRLCLKDSQGRSQTIFLKRYGRCGPAEREWRALQAVRAAGVATMEPVGLGTGAAGGFVMVAAVPGEALSRSMSDLLARHGADPAAMAALAEGLGRLIGQLHSARLAHRDFYTTHVFCRERCGQFDLFLIDLARVFSPRWRRWRWWAKDLAQLKFSLPSDWTRQYWPAVRSAYEAERGRTIPRPFARVIQWRVGQMQRRTKRRLAATPTERA